MHKNSDLKTHTHLLHKKMPYRDQDEQRAYMRSWWAAHPERLRSHRRSEVLQRALQHARLPSRRTAELHAFTEAELRPLVERMLRVRELVGV